MRACAWGRIGGEPAKLICEISSQRMSMTHTQLVAIAGLLALHKSLNLIQGPRGSQQKLSLNVRFSESQIYRPGEVKILLTSALFPLRIFQHRVSVMLPDSITSHSKTFIMVLSLHLGSPLSPHCQSLRLGNLKSYFDFRPYNSMRSSDCHNLRHNDHFEDRRER